MDIVVALKQTGANVTNQIKGQLDSLKKMTDSINFGQVTGAIAVVKSLKTYVDVYDEHRRSVSSLSNALSNIGTNYESVREEVEKTTSALQDKTNYGDEEQIQALSRLVPLIGSYEKSIKVLPKILDLAAFQQTDLKSATDEYAKLLQGELPIGLTRLMPELKKMKEEGRSAGEMMEYLHGKTKNLAEADASPLTIMQGALSDVAKEIGKEILPAITMLKDGFKELPGLAQKLILIAPAIGGAFAVMGGPVTGLVVGVTALTVAFSNLYKSYQDNKKAWQDTQEELKKIAAEVNATQKGIEKVVPTVYNLGHTVDLSKVSLEEFTEAINKSGVSAEQKEKMLYAWRLKNKQLTKEEKKELQDKIKKDQSLTELSIANKQKLDNARAESYLKQREKESAHTAEMLKNKEYGRQKAAELDEQIRAQAQNQADFMGRMAVSIGSALAAGVGQGAEGYKESLKAMLNLTIDYLQQQLIATKVAAIFKGIMSGGISLVQDLTMLAAGTAALQAARVGISKFESGTAYAGGGMALVGERGAELVNLPRGASVMNATQTYQTINNNNSGAGVVVLKGGSDEELAEQLKSATRNKKIDWLKILNLDPNYKKMSILRALT